MAYFDSRDDTFHVEVAPVEPATADTRSSAAKVAELNITLPASNPIPQIPVLVEYVAEPVAEDDEAWIAGYRLYRAGAYHCSTAFPVKKVNGPELGILTAGHCSGSVSYFNTSNYIFTVAPHSLATTDIYPGGDFRWLWSSQMFSGQTHVNSGDLRTFGSAAIAPFNASACKFGNTTGYGCGTVTVSGIYKDVTVMPEDGGGTYPAGPFRGVGTHITSGGDSGGPWFLGSVAYGVHQGTKPSGTISVWSHVTNALTRFNLQLWTG